MRSDTAGTGQRFEVELAIGRRAVLRAQRQGDVGGTAETQRVFEQFHLERVMNFALVTLTYTDEAS